MSLKERKRSQFIKGRVVSDKMDKTRVIEVPIWSKPKLYRKSLLRNRRLFVHDEKNESKAGDLILAASSRPLSKLKSFRLKEVLEKGTQS